MFQLPTPIPFKLNLDFVQTAGGDVLDVGGFFGVPGRMAPVAETFTRGKIVVTVDQSGTPIFISIAEADEIDPMFKDVCERLARRQVVTDSLKDHIARYCVEQTRSILEAAERKRMESLDRLRFENLQMVS